MSLTLARYPFDPRLQSKVALPELILRVCISGSPPPPPPPPVGPVGPTP